MSDDPALPQGRLYQKGRHSIRKRPLAERVRAHRRYLGQRMEVSDVCVVAVIANLRNPIYVLGWALQ